MKNVLVLGAGGQIARWVIRMLEDSPDTRLTLVLRDATRVTGKASENARIVEGDVLDRKLLSSVASGQDVIYANLSGNDIDEQAKGIIESMIVSGVDRLIFVTSLGIYDEVPGKFGEWNRRTIGSYLPPFRRAADAIEASDLRYTILRPAWLTDSDEVDYETTAKGEAFKGTEVSRKSVADLIVKIVHAPDLHARESLGVNKPGTDGDKPTFM